MQMEMHELQSFLATTGFRFRRQRDIGFDFSERFLHGFRQQRNIFVGTFDIVEWSQRVMVGQMDLRPCYLLTNRPPPPDAP